MNQPISIAIETTCRNGGVALGAGAELVEVLPFDAARRATTQLVSRLADLLGRHSLTPADVGELYVSAGPGSFTGTRVGVTVARTWAQVLPELRLVSVPTVQAVAERSADRLDVQHLAVVLDARNEFIHAARFNRHGQALLPAGPAERTTVAELLASMPRPMHVTGEGLGYHTIEGSGVTLLPQELWLPDVQAVWRVGRRLAQAGEFVDYTHLLPLYTGRPEAVRNWEARQK